MRMRALMIGDNEPDKPEDEAASAKVDPELLQLLGAAPEDNDIIEQLAFIVEQYAFDLRDDDVRVGKLTAEASSIEEMASELAQKIKSLADDLETLPGLASFSGAMWNSCPARSGTSNYCPASPGPFAGKSSPNSARAIPTGPIAAAAGKS